MGAPDARALGTATAAEDAAGAEVDAVLGDGAPEELALIRRGVELALGGEDHFVWPHPTDPGRALFAVDDAAVRDAWANASRGNEEVRVNLSKIRDTLVAAIELTSDAMLSMAGDMLAIGRVSSFALLSLGSA